jgi:predicted transcriptional regulator
MFKITDHVTFDQKGRAQCPVCLQNQKTGKNLSLIPGSDGAYKCHRGCLPQDIRDALGQPKSAAIAPSTSPPTKPITVTTDTVLENHRLLMEQSTKAIQWLLNRGFTSAMIQHFALGVGRAKCGTKWLPAITIPLPDNSDSGGWYQKKRVAPWLSESERPSEYKRWSQYGIPAQIWWTHPPNENTFIALACEGEWDAMQIGWLLANSHLGREIASFTFTSGAGNVPKDLSALDGIDEIITLYDLDKAGNAGARQLHARIPDRVKIATIPHRDTPPEGYDLSDAIQAGFTLADIFEAAKQATVPTAVEPQKKENPLKARLFTNDQLIASAPDFIDWLVPDLFPPNELGVLGMPPRGGKSLFGLTLAKAVATGSPFLDRPTTQGSVLYINLEDGPTKIKIRQARQGWAEGLPVHWLTRFKLSELHHLRDLASEIPDLRLVVMDTLSRVRDDGLDESSSKLSSVLEPLQEWAQDAGICVFLIHHTRQQNADSEVVDVFDRLRGSSAIRGTCRFASLILPADNSYRLISENGFTDRIDINIRLNPESLEWKMLGNWTPRIDADMKTQILDHLALHGEATVAEIARQLNFNAASVSTIMSRLQRDDMVARRGGGGRAPAMYARSNLFKQLEAQFEQPSASGVSDTALLKQEKIPLSSEEKVSNGENVSKKLLTFTADPPKGNILFEQSCNPGPASDTCSNSSSNQFEQVCTEPSEQFQQPVQTEVIKAGDRAIYSGDNWQRQKMFGKRHLEVISRQENEEGIWVTVKHPALQVQQTVPASDLRKVSR